MEFGNDILTLVDEDGVESQFELLDELEYEGEYYYAATPYFENSADSVDEYDELIVFKLEGVVGEEAAMVTVDDDEYDEIAPIFLEKFDEILED